MSPIGLLPVAGTRVADALGCGIGVVTGAVALGCEIATVAVAFVGCVGDGALVAGGLLPHAANKVSGITKKCAGRSLDFILVPLLVISACCLSFSCAAKYQVVSWDPKMRRVRIITALPKFALNTPLLYKFAFAFPADANVANHR